MNAVIVLSNCVRTMLDL